VLIKSNDHEETNYYISLLPHESKTYYLDMTNIPHVDGDYRLKFKDEDNQNHFKRFGYFTNGASMEDSTIINIYSDSIIVNQIYTKYK
jgi:hypothetical protein